ncbi:MAG: class I SAM-dependent methyltransferase, partial [Bacteroidetes bacterium]|nr:class I SAM-dependent methyltransferase [Bacteroidota bacterium]
MVKQTILSDRDISGKLNPCDELLKEVAVFKNASSGIQDDTYNFLKSSAVLHQMLATIRLAEMEGLDKEIIREIVSPVRDILATSALVKRMQTWPRGFPGDFETIEWLCDGALNKMNSSTQVLDNILLYSPTAQQHRNKVVWQGNQVLKTIQNQTSAKVLSIACGGSRDLLSIVPFLNHQLFSLCLNDVDNEALNLSVERMKDYTCNLEIVQGDVFHSVRKLNKFGPFDIIVAGGLFDYLDNRQAIWLLTHLIKMLKPDGNLCFTNISKGIPYNGWLDYLANWQLIARNSADIENLLHNAGA